MTNAMRLRIKILKIVGFFVKTLKTGYEYQGCKL